MSVKFKKGDTVKILDEYRISNYAGGWAVSPMSKYIGKTFKVKTVKYNRYANSYMYRHDGYWFDERGLELVKSNEAIVIYRDGNKTIALNKSTGNKAEAICSPEDEFDFITGAKIAFDRLVNPKEPEKFLNTKVIFVSSKPSRNGLINNKIYNIVDGKITDENGLDFPMNKRFKTIDDVKAYFGGYETKGFYEKWYDCFNPREVIEVLHD